MSFVKVGAPAAGTCSAVTVLPDHTVAAASIANAIVTVDPLNLKSDFCNFMPVSWPD